MSPEPEETAYATERSLAPSSLAGVLLPDNRLLAQTAGIVGGSHGSIDGSYCMVCMFPIASLLPFTRVPACGGRSANPTAYILRYYVSGTRRSDIVVNGFRR